VSSTASSSGGCKGATTGVSAGSQGTWGG
jgi:hypothetical protein